MKVYGRRWFGAAALALLFSVGSVGCSGDQDTEEGVEASDDQAANNEDGGDNTASEGDAKDAADGGGDAAAAAPADAGAGDAAASGSETADAAGAAAGGGENDLQDIISEMNGQQPSGDAASADAGDTSEGTSKETAAAAPAAAAAAAATPASASAPAPTSTPAAKGGSTAALPAQPGGAPAGLGLPEVGSTMAYIVEKGDTLAKISQKIFGSTSHWQEMASLSGITNPSRIYPGDLVYYTLDESAVAFAKAYEAVQRAEEQVKPGDTLATISKRVYGETSGWRSIWRHNDNIDNPDVVQTGSTVFYIPKGAMQAAIEKAKLEISKIVDNNTNHSAKKLSARSNHRNHVGHKSNGTHSNLVTKTGLTSGLEAGSV